MEGISLPGPVVGLARGGQGALMQPGGLIPVTPAFRELTEAAS
jgi:hypothetical protein